MNSISGLTCYAKDLQASTSFYEALGFRIGNRSDDSMTCYVNWFWITFIAAASTDDPEATLPNRGAGQHLYIKVNDIDEFYKGVLAKGMKPTSEPVKQPSGNREFMLRDPDSYKLVFFEKN